VEIVAAAHAALAQLEHGGGNEEKENVAQLVKEIRRLQSDLQSQLVSLATPNVHATKKGKIQRSMVRMGFGSALTEQILDQMPEHAGLGWVTQVLERNLRALRGDEVIVGGGGFLLWWDRPGWERRPPPPNWQLGQWSVMGRLEWGS
jgi:hypothetical protein